MCLAIPAQLVEVIEPGLANAEVSGVRREVSTVLVPEAQVGRSSDRTCGLATGAQATPN